MPYIKMSERTKFNDQIDYLTQMTHNPGELNYVITKLVIGYLKTHEKNYKTMNEIVGVLECSKAEFYRRVMAPYENEKMTHKESGDVYE